MRACRPEEKDPVDELLIASIKAANKSQLCLESSIGCLTQAIIIESPEEPQRNVENVISKLSHPFKTSCSIFGIRSATLKGLLIASSIPHSSAALTWASLAFAETAIMGRYRTMWPCSWSFRIRRTHSMPPITGTVFRVSKAHETGNCENHARTYFQRPSG